MYIQTRLRTHSKTHARIHTCTCTHGRARTSTHAHNCIATYTDEVACHYVNYEIHTYACVLHTKQFLNSIIDFVVTMQVTLSIIYGIVLLNSHVYRTGGSIPLSLFKCNAQKF